ncbi:MAG: ATP-binding protein [Hyphomicrobiaceae bacterium]
MTLNSLAFRLFATAALWTLLVLAIAGVVIDYVHKREAEAAFDTRLSQILTQIIAFSTLHEGDEPRVPKIVGEPLFELTHSGWYWQITPLDNAPGRRMVSASLAGESLILPSTLKKRPDPTNIIWYNTTGPVGESLRIAENVYNAGEDESPRFYSFLVAGDAETTASVNATFRLPLTIALGLAGLVLVAATLFQVRFVLWPLQVIEKRLSDIRSGNAEKLDGVLPSEVAPLQTELNALIRSNQEIVERARTQVGNLAHALKTPLAVILNEARDDKGTSAQKIAEQATVMHDQVNYYLDRARMAARAGLVGRQTEVFPVAEGIVRALERIYSERRLDLSVDCPATARFLGEKQDLEEMLGNLLDNACKWAASRVVLKVVADEAAARPVLRISVDDDGPGLTPEQRAQGIARGRKLDETKPGSGLGHSIIAELAQSYRGTFALEQASLGGLSARLELPAA